MTTKTKKKPLTKKDAFVGGLWIGGGSQASLGSVQGIDANLDDLKLTDGNGLIFAIGAAVSDADLKRDIEGASTLTLTCHDPKRVLLAKSIMQHKFDVQLDDLWFTLVKVVKSGDDITLTFEDKEVNLLRPARGAKSAVRGKITRAEFIRSMVREIRKPYKIPFYSPQLHKKQPIASAAQASAQSGSSDLTRQPGIGSADRGKITVKHTKASPSQIQILNDALTTANSMHANERVMISEVMTITQESNASNLHGSGGYGPFSQLKNGAWPASGDTSKDAAAYVRKAIASDKSNPHQSLAALCQSVQASANGSLYAQWEGEARATVAVFLHGAPAGAGGGATSDMGKTTKYAFKRQKKEGTWDCSGRLADEVGWRRFVSAGIFYYMSEAELYDSKPRLVLRPGVPGLDDIDFDLDEGQPISQLTATVRTNRWFAPPGTTVQVEGYGMANGKWLITQIDTSLFEPTAEITLKLPIPKLPEPAPQAKTGGGKGGDATASASSAGSSKLDKAVAEMDRIDKLHLSYNFGGSHGAGKAPPNGPFDCSSAVSRVLEVVEVLSSTQTTVGLASWGHAGEGADFTVWVKNGGPGGGHTFISAKVNGTWKCWGTSSSNPGSGPGWHYDRRGESGFSPRHIAGL